MKFMYTNEIRNKFLDFFEKKGHKIYSSFPLIPINDKSLLLINSGMAPLKKFFTNEQIPINKQITSCQKCIRTQDIEIIGKTLRHSTFFEMLGNFSFGTYFKYEAIIFAWEFITQILNIPKNKLFISVYYKDEETYNIWIKDIKIDKNHIVKLGKKDNFWEIGSGPCGPSTEIYYDYGKDDSCNNENCTVGCECNRYIEFWNLVFSQFNSDGNGNYTNLKRKNIDTGMGLERISAILQNVNSIFEIDIAIKIIKNIKKFFNLNNLKKSDYDIPIKIIYDHIKSIVMMLADGIVPTHDGRGYVLKRLIRRSIYYGSILGCTEYFLYKMAPLVVDEYSSIYSSLKDNYDFIINTIYEEEKKFKKTLITGKNILEKKILDLKENEKKYITDNELLFIYNTYGLPIEISKEILKKNNINIFNENKKQNNDNKHLNLKNTNNNMIEKLELLNLELDSIKYQHEYYNKIFLSSNVLKILDINYNLINQAKINDNIIIITLNTPFYAESGGQKSDIGYIKNKNCYIEIYNVLSYRKDIFLHFGKVISGELNSGDNVDLIVDNDNRYGLMRAHTVVHILHQLLRNKYGTTVRQYGSNVDNDSFRFDITYNKNFSVDEIKIFENEINNIIFKNLSITTKYISINDLAEENITALFQEKYDSNIRVVNIDNYSKEVCKGFHVNNTNEICICKILSVTTIANGIKRFYVLTGKKALKYYENTETKLTSIKQLFNSNDDNLINKIHAYNSEILKLKSNYKNLINNYSKILINNMKYQILKNIKLYIEIEYDINNDILKEITNIIKKEQILKNNVFIFINNYSHKQTSQIFIYSSKNIINDFFNAKNILKTLLIKLEGKGGGDKIVANGVLNCYNVEKNVILEILKEKYF